MDIIQEIHSCEWEAAFSPTLQAQAAHALESGKILLFPQLPFRLQAHEEVFMSPSFADLKSKNISFNTHTGKVRGLKTSSVHDGHLKKMMHRYANNAHGLLAQLFPSYAATIQRGRTSFRPVEILGRIPKSYRKDDTRLHVDAFPTSPTQGKRILRVFTNINPCGQERLWKVGEPFEHVANQFLSSVKRPWLGRAALFNALGITKSYCTEYDYIMLQIHNHMKADLGYQKSAAQCEIRFWPQSTWIVQTDHVSHAALSGQYVLEQTFYLPVNAMVDPNLSPLRTLEKKMGRSLV